MHTHLISVDQLKALQASGAPLMVFDCSFDLADPARPTPCSPSSASQAACRPTWAAT